MPFNFDENELSVVLKSLWDRKYFDKILDDLDSSQWGHAGVKWGKIVKCF